MKQDRMLFGSNETLDHVVNNKIIGSVYKKLIVNNNRIILFF